METTESARAYVLRLLARRGYGVGEMEERLVRRGTPPEVRKEVLGRLVREGLLDDAAYALSIARSRAERGWGPRKVSAVLGLRKLDRNTVAQALREAFAGDRAQERARQLLENRRARFREDKTAENPRRGRERALRFLVSRGYTLECARCAIREVFGYNPATLDGDD